MRRAGFVAQALLPCFGGSRCWPLRLPPPRLQPARLPGSNGLFYPQRAANDSSHAVGEALLRYEAFAVLCLPALAARNRWPHRYPSGDRARSRGSLMGTARRGPLLSVRRLSATYTRGQLNVEAGKQSSGGARPTCSSRPTALRRAIL